MYLIPLQAAAVGGCARHGDASGHLQPQPCGCRCPRCPRPLPTMSPCKCHQLAPPRRPQPRDGGWWLLGRAQSGFGAEGRNLRPQQWSGLSELLRPRFITVHTLELLFGENVTRRSKRRSRSRPLRPTPCEADWGGMEGPGSSAGLLCPPRVFSPFCWGLGPLELPCALPSPPCPIRCPPRWRCPYLRGTSPASRRGRAASSACPRSAG